MDEIHIRCSDCLTTKPITEFHKNKGRKHGINKICKPCTSVRAKEYNLRPEVKEAKSKRHKEWLDANREYKKEYVKEWYKLNKEHKDRQVKEWQENNKEWDKKRRKQYYEDNKERLLAYQYKRREKNPNYIKDYARDNKERIDEKRRIYEIKRRKENIEHRLRCTLRSRIYKAIKRFNYNRQNSSIDELGCSIKEYVIYLEERFTGEMSWANYGSLWEIDHIHPLSRGGSFHYTNTQPLTALENSVKGNKLTEELKAA